MNPTTKSIYTLITYDGGEESTNIATTDVREASRAYRGYYERNGTAPRLLIDGERIPINIADKLMLHRDGGSERGRKPPYVNRSRNCRKTS